MINEYENPWGGPPGGPKGSKRAKIGLWKNYPGALSEHFGPFRTPG